MPCCRETKMVNPCSTLTTISTSEWIIIANHGPTTQIACNSHPTTLLQMYYHIYQTSISQSYVCCSSSSLNNYLKKIETRVSLTLTKRAYFWTWPVCFSCCLTRCGYYSQTLRAHHYVTQEGLHSPSVQVFSNVCISGINSNHTILILFRIILNLTAHPTASIT